MFAKKHWIPIVLFAVVLAACGSGGQEAPLAQSNSNSEVFSATANSAVSVVLAWAEVSGASEYLVEAKYGAGDYFEVAQLGGDESTFTHFVVPNSKDLTYRLSAVKATVNEQIGTASVSMPELAPNPVVITEIIPFLPSIGGGDVDFSSMPTLDPLNPDPNAMATMIAMAEGLAGENPEDLLAELEPISATQTIGPEGGTVEVTDPNGVAYSLEVPAGVVDQETTFKLDPLEIIGGVPFQHLLAAADIFPALPFYEPLKLRITLPEEAISADETITAFIGSKSNSELSMTPVYQKENELIVHIFWGDVVGIATATRDEILEQAIKTPTDSGEQISQQIAVMQALSEDKSFAGFSRLIDQIFEGLIEQIAQSSALHGGSPGMLSAPQRQSGSESGIVLWNDISRIQTLWNHYIIGANEQTGQADPSVLTPQQRFEEVASLIVRINEFLKTHTGCRTRDEFYAEALLQILTHPEGNFQEAVAADFTKRFGSPEALKNCTYIFHVTTSDISVEDTEGRLTIKAHTNPFNLEVVVRAEKISLRGAGPVIYDRLRFLAYDCPPEFDVQPPSISTMWISNLIPIFDLDLKVVNFQLLGVSPDPLSGTPVQLNADVQGDTDSCEVVKVFYAKVEVDVWTAGIAGGHNFVINKDSWSIEGEKSYIATNRIVKYSFANISETSTMVLTVLQEKSE
jgi:hypothetical protein